MGPCDHGSCPATVVRVLIDDFEMYILRSSLLDLREDGGVLRAEIVANGVGGGGAEPEISCQEMEGRSAWINTHWYFIKGVMVEVWMAAMVGPSVRSQLEIERGMASGVREVGLKIVRRAETIVEVLGSLLTLSLGKLSWLEC